MAWDAGNARGTLDSRRAGEVGDCGAGGEDDAEDEVGHGDAEDGAQEGRDEGQLEI